MLCGPHERCNPIHRAARDLWKLDHIKATLRKSMAELNARPYCSDDRGSTEPQQDYLFSMLPPPGGRKPLIGVGAGNGVDRGAPNDGADVGDGTGRGATGWVGQGAAGAAVGIGRGVGAVNGAGDTGFGVGASVTAGLIAMVIVFALAYLLVFLIAFLAIFFVATFFFAADFPFFLRISNTLLVFFTFDFDFFALLFDFLAMIAS
jgi:hypothetical protein